MSERSDGDLNRIVNHALVPPVGTFKFDPVHTFVGFSARHLVDRRRLAGDGRLEVHGVTRPVEFTVRFGGAVIDAYGNARVAFHAHGAITRQEIRTYV